MVKIEEQEEYSEEDDSTNSTHTKPNPNKASSSTINNHDSPSSTSSISSDHTFHGFSPSKSNPPSPSQSHPSLVLVPSPAPAQAPAQAPVLSTSRLVRDQPEVITRTESDAEVGFASEEKIGKRKRSVGGNVNRERRGKVLNRVGLVLRVVQFLVSLVSFCVMSSDKRRGWALDSFHNYIEFKYSMTINIISFAYAGLQGLDLIIRLSMGKGLARSRLRCCIDFGMDQILAYLLLSSSSSAFTRIDDWISNWGKDKFPEIASAAVGVSFLAFFIFALSSLISGYTLCTRKH